MNVNGIHRPKLAFTCNVHLHENSVGPRSAGAMDATERVPTEFSIFKASSTQPTPQRLCASAVTLFTAETPRPQRFFPLFDFRFPLLRHSSPSTDCRSLVHVHIHVHELFHLSPSTICPSPISDGAAVAQPPACRGCGDLPSPTARLPIILRPDGGRPPWSSAPVEIPVPVVRPFRGLPDPTYPLFSHPEAAPACR